MTSRWVERRPDSRCARLARRTSSAGGSREAMRDAVLTRKVRRKVVAFSVPFLRKGRLNMLRVPWRRPRERARWLPIPSSCCYPLRAVRRGGLRGRVCEGSRLFNDAGKKACRRKSHNLELFPQPYGELVRRRERELHTRVNREENQTGCERSHPHPLALRWSRPTEGSATPACWSARRRALWKWRVRSTRLHN